ncbi:MAG: ankyrin repeat domain-containing protein [Magnetococcales bacterium]|nr:ankyrin repeat domain-containing protein [Magnetococcales bacterium]
MTQEPNPNPHLLALGITAARRGDIQTLRQWLQAGNNPNQHDADGWTPLLWASVRGYDDLVTLLLDQGADPTLPHQLSGALPIHLLGHAGNVCAAKVLLDRWPLMIDAVWDLNGHTILLQAVFYNHPALASELVRRGASTAITTARGLGPMELAGQFQNKTMQAIIRPCDASAAEKSACYSTYLARIAPIVPPEEKPAQDLADQLVQTISDGLAQAAKDAGTVASTLQTVRRLVEERKADVNRLGGPLQQPALVVTVTGNNGFPPNANVANLRHQLADYLLQHGADPTLHEKHPMGAQSIIRGAVFNHLDILRLCAKFISAEKLTAAINEVPIVNGLTALHDTVLRASTADPAHLEGYLQQAAWFVACGGRSDMEDFSGRTQRRIAEETQDLEVRRRLLAVLDEKPPTS